MNRKKKKTYGLWYLLACVSSHPQPCPFRWNKVTIIYWTPNICEAVQPYFWESSQPSWERGIIIHYFINDDIKVQKGAVTVEDYWTERQYYDIVWVCFVFGNCNHCFFCCGHPCTMLGVSLFISCKNKIQCVCVKKKHKNISFFFFF